MANLRSLFFLLLIFVILPSQAQQRFIMGVKSGLNLATQEIDGPFPAKTRYRPRMHIGIITEWRFKKLSLQPEFMYSGHGYQYTGTIHPNLKATFEYINVPIFLKYKLTKGLSILAGPQFGMLFDHEFEDDRNGFSISRSDFSTVFTRFETSIGGGLEYQFENRTGLYARYIHGITEIDNGVSFLDPTKNRTFQFGASYRF